MYAGLLTFQPVCQHSWLQYISRIFTLEPGDVILTGTPEGVGPVAAGETMEV